MKQALVRVIALLCVGAVAAAGSSVAVFGQEAAANDVNKLSYEAQIYVIVASNQQEGKSDLPRLIDPAIKQIGETLPYKNFRLATAWIGRFRDRGGFNLKGITSPKLWNQSSSPRPLFYELDFGSIKIEATNENRASISVENFRLDTISAVPEFAPRSDGTEAVIQSSYRNSGVKTSLLIREGVPTVVGSFGTGISDDQLVVVVLVRRAT